MGCRLKGKDTSSRSASHEKEQTRVSSFFSPQVAPVFEKPQERMREAAAAGGEASTLPLETVTILDYEPEAGAAADNEVGQDTADNDATESDGGEAEHEEQSSMTEKVTSSS
eukprot:1603102-Rhodomonas_salina.2